MAKPVILMEDEFIGKDVRFSVGDPTSFAARGRVLDINDAGVVFLIIEVEQAYQDSKLKSKDKLFVSFDKRLDMHTLSE